MSKEGFSEGDGPL